MGTVRLISSAWPLALVYVGACVVGGFGDVLSIPQLLLLFHHSKHTVILPMYRGSTIKRILEKKNSEIT